MLVDARAGLVPERGGRSVVGATAETRLEVDGRVESDPRGSRFAIGIETLVDALAFLVERGPLVCRRLHLGDFVLKQGPAVLKSVELITHLFDRPGRITDDAAGGVDLETPAMPLQQSIVFGEDVVGPVNAPPSVGDRLFELSALVINAAQFAGETLLLEIDPGEDRVIVSWRSKSPVAAPY